MTIPKEIFFSSLRNILELNTQFLLPLELYWKPISSVTTQNVGQGSANIPNVNESSAAQLY